MTSAAGPPSAAGTSPAAGAPTDRAARLADSFVRARDGDPGALDAVVRELNPLLWHIAREQGLARRRRPTSSRPPGWSCSAGCMRSALRRR